MAEYVGTGYLKTLNNVSLFPIAYFGNIAYYRHLISIENPIFQLSERYQKQSYRNRCEIYSANGKLSLSVPIIKTKGSKSLTHEIAICYKDNWQKNHWRAISSAYGKSPYFIYYEDDIRLLLNHKFDFLHQLDLEIIKQSLRWLHFELALSCDSEINPFKENTHPGFINYFQEINFKQYHQVFEEKFGFIENLSILDLIFNEGPNSQLFVCQ